MFCKFKLCLIIHVSFLNICIFGSADEPLMSVVLDRGKRDAGLGGLLLQEEKTCSWREKYCSQSFVLFGFWYNLHDSA